MAGTKRKINAKQIIRDVRDGCTDLEIMGKHELSPKELDHVFQKLIQINALTQDELDERSSGKGYSDQASQTPPSKSIVCSSCGKEYPETLVRCPSCGFSELAGPSKAPVSPGPVPQRQSSGIGRIIVISGAVILVIMLATVATYYFYKEYQEEKLAKQISEEEFLTLQEKAEAFASQNELSGLVALGSEEEISEAFSNPNFDVDAPDIDGRTLLLVAVEYGREDVVRDLLYYDANIYTVDKECNTPAILAAKKGHNGILDLLVDKAYDLDFKNIHGESVRSIAHNSDNKELKEIVLQATRIPGRTVKHNLKAFVRQYLKAMDWRCDKLCRGEFGVKYAMDEVDVPGVGTRLARKKRKIRTVETKTVEKEEKLPTGETVRYQKKTKIPSERTEEVERTPSMQIAFPVCKTRCKAKFAGCLKRHFQDRLRELEKH